MLSHSKSFAEFVAIPIFFYKSIGHDLFEYKSNNHHHHHHRLRSRFRKFLLYLGFINFNLLSAGEVAYLVSAIKSSTTILEATSIVPCVGFSLVANFKQFALVAHKVVLQNHFNEIEKVYSITTTTLAIADKSQQWHFVKCYERATKRIMVICSFLCLAYTSVFSLYPAFKSAILYWFFGAAHFQRDFGFLIWYPYNATSNNFVYTITYLGQVHGAYLAGVAFLSADLLLIGSVTILCANFDCISAELRCFRVTKDTLCNHAFLHSIIRRHIQCLELSEQVNKIFNISLLLNFITSSSMICFIGFQVTASSFEVICKYCIFLVASMVQVLVVCYYGDKLIDASMNVGFAAYSQNWFDADFDYQRKILFLMRRSQTPASIRAPTFPPISLRTYMNVISLSYQFFALLKTTYYK